MSAENRNFIINRVLLLVIFLFITSCLSKNNISAPIHYIDGSQYSTPEDKIIVSTIQICSKPNQNTHSTILSPILSKIEDKKIKTMKNIINFQPVKIKNGHLLYNRQYRNIPKGIYKRSSTYTVKQGDTLFYIAWITDDNFQNLAKQNNISAPYKLYVGQILRIKKKKDIPFIKNDTTTINGITSQYKNNSIKSEKETKIPFASKLSATLSDISNKKNINQDVNKPIPTSTSSLINSSKLSTKNKLSNLSIFVWCWPTYGKIINKFSFLEGGNKGIDIAGSKGQSIVAAKDGFVVYAGNALRGYGNLIIIKHNNDYLSAYAHNDTILVREKQKVRVGQKIATMGSSGTNSTRLHFEIRYKGKSVNPLKYLPQNTLNRCK